MSNNKFTIQKPLVSVSQTLQNNYRKFVITKRIAKHGRQAVIIVPALLQGRLCPGTLAEITIEVLD